MKKRRKYYLFFNSLTRVAIIGNKKFFNRMEGATIGQLYTCTFREAVENSKLIKERGYTLTKRNY